MNYRLSLLTVLLFFLATALTVEPVHAQRDNSRVRPSPNAKVSQTIGTTEIDLHYSRPGVKGRTIFGDLVPYDQVWRAGANEPTTITFSGDVVVEGKSLAAGSYALWFLPRASGKWEVIFSDLVGWGTQYDPEKDVLRAPVTPMEGAAQEWLRYTFEDLTDTSATLQMHWATTVVPVHIKLP